MHALCLCLAHGPCVCLSRRPADSLTWLCEVSKGHAKAQDRHTTERRLLSTLPFHLPASKKQAAYLVVKSAQAETASSNITFCTLHVR